MNIISRHDALHGGVVQNPATFSGDVRMQMIYELSDPEAIRINTVRFDPGVRNAWHAHAGGQVLHVVEGQCLFQLDGEEVVVLEAGDSVVAEPGEVHWHGASEAGPMTHLAVTLGETTFSSSFNEH